MNKIKIIFNLYSDLINDVSKMITFIRPTKNNWSALGKPTDHCPIYAYRERFDGGFNQTPIQDLSLNNQLEISNKLNDEFGDLNN